MTNGASKLLSEVFGAAGVHARSAFGVAQISLGACVETELVAGVRPGQRGPERPETVAAAVSQASRAEPAAHNASSSAAVCGLP